VISAATLTAYLAADLAFGWSREEQVTVSFLTLAMAQLWHVFNMREHGASLLNNQMSRNRYVWGALVLCIGLLLGAVYIAPVSAVLSTTPLDGAGWALVLGCSVIPLIADRVARIFYRVAAR
jgi:Ca2+-transporting ATPase